MAVPPAPRPAPIPRAADSPAPEPARGSRGTPNARPPANEADAALAALRQSTEQRARILTSKGDVKGLLALRAEAGKRYRQLGASRPEVLAEVLQALDAKLDEARAVRLRLDAEAIRR